MRSSLSLRIAAVLAGFDIVFAAIASASFLALIGVHGAAERSYVLGLGTAIHLGRIAVWLGVLRWQLRPLERWLRLGDAAPPDVFDPALRAAQRLPLRFATVLALLWGASYVLLTAILFYTSPDRVVLDRALVPPAGLFATATLLAAFPFALLWTEYLSAPARARISLAAGAAAAVMGGSRFSLRHRILLLTLCLTLAPTVWIMSMVSGAMLRIGPGIPPDAVWTIGVFFLAVALWAPICAWLLVRTLARPIGTIAATMAEITRRRDPAAAPRIPIFQNDELGSLAAGANEMIGRLSDEMERRAAIAAENERLLHAARAAVRAREHFLEIASHELRTPLTPLRLNLEQLQRELERSGAYEDLTRKLEASRRQAERLVRLAEDLLDVSASAEGEIPLRREVVDVAELTREVAARQTADATRVGSVLQIEASAPAVAWVDRRRIARVLSLLLDNALKFGAGKPIRVRVGALHGKIRVTVRDQGPGIPPEDQERIFERFERGVSELHYGGLGIGLYMARRIVEGHGGRLTVRSRPGAGSTFNITLPTTPEQRRQSAGPQ